MMLVRVRGLGVDRDLSHKPNLQGIRCQLLGGRFMDPDLLILRISLSVPPVTGEGSFPGFARRA